MLCRPFSSKLICDCIYIKKIQCKFVQSPIEMKKNYLLFPFPTVSPQTMVDRERISLFESFSDSRIWISRSFERVLITDIIIISFFHFHNKIYMMILYGTNEEMKTAFMQQSHEYEWTSCHWIWQFAVNQIEFAFDWICRWAHSATVADLELFEHASIFDVVLYIEFTMLSLYDQTNQTNVLENLMVFWRLFGVFLSKLLLF